MQVGSYLYEPIESMAGRVGVGALIHPIFVFRTRLVVNLITTESLRTHNKGAKLLLSSDFWKTVLNVNIKTAKAMVKDGIFKGLFAGVVPHLISCPLGYFVKEIVGSLLSDQGDVAYANQQRNRVLTKIAVLAESATASNDPTATIRLNSLYYQLSNYTPVRVSPQYIGASLVANAASSAVTYPFTSLVYQAILDRSLESVTDYRTSPQSNPNLSVNTFSDLYDSSKFLNLYSGFGYYLLATSVRCLAQLYASHSINQIYDQVDEAESSAGAVLDASANTSLTYFSASAIGLLARAVDVKYLLLLSNLNVDFYNIRLISNSSPQLHFILYYLTY